jgi:hypothetical protein
MSKKDKKEKKKTNKMSESLKFCSGAGCSIKNFRMRAKFQEKEKEGENDNT